MNRKQGSIFWLLLLMTLSLRAQVTDSLRKDSTQYAPARRQHFTGYEISGKVTDADDGQPVPFAPVFFKDGSTGTTTDVDGKYFIQVESLPDDSLKIQVIGYDAKTIRVDRNRRKAVHNIQLHRSATYLEEVVIKPGEDPAIVLMREVIRAKPYNNPDKLANYRYEAYNKIQIDLLNFKRKTFEKLPVPYLKQLGFIFDNMDSTSYDKPYLPLYLTEAISDNYYQSEPRKNKEYIRATQIKVLNNKNMMNSMSQYLGRIYLAINPYDNYVPFFDKEFVSPASNTALTFYRYKIIDTQKVNGRNVITLHFTPQRKGENCFEGTLKIVDSVYAIQYIAADMPPAANVNWVKKSSFYKEYSSLGDTLWFCTKENITAELELSDEVVRTLGFIVRKTTSYKDIAVNQDSISNIVNSKEFKRDVIVADSATAGGEDFWATARHEELNEQERGIYQMYDSLEKNRAFNNLKTLGKI
ncbi:MAG TPA: DUF5686 family protein, partial [Flavipsychrobacter sp.]|nr:DUF5686 family protein [Flavipsychrobacter sp.]